jgi:uncharacterized protein
MVAAQTSNPKYDKLLADSMGADAYGMKMYVLVILKAGQNKMEDKSKSDSLFAGHFQNISRLVKAGKLVVSGPIKKNDKGYQGIFILNCKTIEEAALLLDTDPAIKSNLLDAEMFQWYGSAALPLYLPYHDKVKRSDI